LADFGDPRVNRNQRHELLDAIFSAIAGAICWADSRVDLELFDKAEWDSKERTSSPR